MGPKTCELSILCLCLKRRNRFRGSPASVPCVPHAFSGCWPSVYVMLAEPLSFLAVHEHLFTIRFTATRPRFIYSHIECQLRESINCPTLFQSHLSPTQDLLRRDPPSILTCILLSTFLHMHTPYASTGGRGKAISTQRAKFRSSSGQHTHCLPTQQKPNSHHES